MYTKLTFTLLKCKVLFNKEIIISYHVRGSCELIKLMKAFFLSPYYCKEFGQKVGD